QIVGVRQLARRSPLLAPDAHQLAVGREHLDAVVAGVGGVEVAVGAERQRPNAAELTRLLAVAAPGEEELAVGVELADAMVLAELGDVPVAVGVLNDVADVAELPGPGAGLAAEVAQLDAVGVVDAPAVVMGVADDEVAVTVDAQTTGPAVAVVGSN